MLINIVLMSPKKKITENGNEKRGAELCEKPKKPNGMDMLCEEKRQKEQWQTFIEIHAGRYGEADLRSGERIN